MPWNSDHELARKAKRVWGWLRTRVQGSFRRERRHVYTCTCIDCGGVAIVRRADSVSVEQLHSFNSEFRCSGCDSVNVCIQTQVAPTKRVGWRRGGGGGGGRVSVYGYRQFEGHVGEVVTHGSTRR